jgi:hypothetical protein
MGTREKYAPRRREELVVTSKPREDLLLTPGEFPSSPFSSPAVTFEKTWFRLNCICYFAVGFEHEWTFESSILSRPKSTPTLPSALPRIGTNDSTAPPA